MRAMGDLFCLCWKAQADAAECLMGLQAPSRHRRAAAGRVPPGAPPSPPLPASQQLTQHCCTEVGFAPMQLI